MRSKFYKPDPHHIHMWFEIWLKSDFGNAFKVLMVRSDFRFQFFSLLGMWCDSNIDSAVESTVVWLHSFTLAHSMSGECVSSFRQFMHEWLKTVMPLTFRRSCIFATCQWWHSVLKIEKKKKRKENWCSKNKVKDLINCKHIVAQMHQHKLLKHPCSVG